MMTESPKDEFSRPPVHDRPAGVAQVAAAVAGKPLPPRPERPKA